MRNVVLAFVTALCVAGCGGGGATVDGGGKDSGGGGNPDLSKTGGGGDMSMSAALNCGQIIDCTNNAMSQTAFNKCVNSGTATGKMLFNALDMCITTQCGSLAGDGGTAGPCGTIATCVSCVQTGQGKTMMNGMCAATQGGPTVTDPKCGQCVDQLIGCANDM